VVSRAARRVSTRSTDKEGLGSKPACCTRPSSADNSWRNATSSMRTLRQRQRCRQRQRRRRLNIGLRARRPRR
jgi:hypothetical protein